MMNWMRQRLRSDAGLTLIEMLVAIVVLAVTLSALASTIITSLATVSRDEARVRATQLANQALEDLRGMRWHEVGFYSGDAGYQATFEGNDTVTLGTSRPAGSPAPLPGPQPRERDGIAYTVTTNIYSLPDPSDPTLEDLKGFHVLVEWSERGRAFTFESTATRAPTLQEVPLEEPDPVPATFEILDYAVSPALITISESGTTQQAIYVDVTTSKQANSVLLTAGLAVPIPLEAVPDSGGMHWRTEIASGKNWFTAGQHEFSVTANGVGGETREATKLIAFVNPDETSVEILAPTLSPAPPICVRANGLPWQPVAVTFEVRGVGVDDAVSIRWTSKSGEAPASSAEPTDEGVRFTAVIPTDAEFEQGSTTVTLRATRQADSVSAAEPYAYQVVVKSDEGDCP